MSDDTIVHLKNKYDQLLSIVQNDIPKLFSNSNVNFDFAQFIPTNALVEPTILTQNADYSRIFLVSFYVDKINHLKLVLSLSLITLLKNTNLYSPMIHDAVNNLVANL